MSKVVLGGSRSVSRLSAPVRERVENIVSQGFDVVIGDANGADKALQEYLANRGCEGGHGLLLGQCLPKQPRELEDGLRLH